MICEFNYIRNDIAFGEASTPPTLVSNPKTGVTYGAYNGWVTGPTIAVIDAYANRVVTNISLNEMLYHTDIAIDTEKNLIYLTLIDLLNGYSGIISTIDIK